MCLRGNKEGGRAQGKQEGALPVLHTLLSGPYRTVAGGSFKGSMPCLCG